MCDTCGCNVTDGNRHLVEAGGKHATTESGKEAVSVLQNLLSENDHAAAHNREHFDRHNVLALNLMSSPGSGKTALLESTIERLGREFRIAVVEGDLETENDAARIRDKGVEAIQITTGTACHLDAHMVHDALHQLDLQDVDILFIENVGNLVCPAEFDLGHTARMAVLSVTEGEEKPLKYPLAFRVSDLAVLSKIDLLPHLKFDLKAARANMRKINGAIPLVELSAQTGEGLDRWVEWVNGLVEKRV